MTEPRTESGLAVLDWLIAFDWLIAHENHTLHFGRDHGGGAHIRCASPDGGYLRVAIPSRAAPPHDPLHDARDCPECDHWLAASEAAPPSKKVSGGPR